MSKKKEVVVDVADQIKSGLMFFNVSGKTYLGKKEGKTITGMLVVSTRVSRDVIASYIKDLNENKLVTFNMSKTTEYQSVDIVDEDEIIIDSVISTFKLAIKNSDKWLVNKVFDKYLGKK